MPKLGGLQQDDKIVIRISQELKKKIIEKAGVVPLSEVVRKLLEDTYLPNK
jgi:hypothetical protein